jgi:ABC-2 type transport system permease protein
MTMNHLYRITLVEARLLAREPAPWLAAVLLPTIVLLAIGTLFPLGGPDPSLGGRRYIDLFVPSMIVLSLASLGLNTMPGRLAKYREGGVLRRLSTTPASPATLLVAQLLINALVAILAVALLIVVGNVAFAIPLPKDLLGFLAAFSLGMSSLFALGLLVAAVAPTTGAATAMFLPLFAAVMFLGGVYLPRWLLPEIIVRIGDFTPPGVQALLDTWSGTPPQLLPLVVMGAITVVAGMLATRSFRWE